MALPLVPLAALTSTASAGGTFGTGAPALVVSQAPSALAFSDQAGEPSVGVDWQSGSTLYMARQAVLRLAFDSAGAATWTDTSPVTGNAALPKSNFDPVLMTEPRSGLTLAGGDTLACSALWASSDDGASWTPSVPCTGTYDHPTVGWAPSATTPGAVVLYYCQQGPLVQQCATSKDRGATWLPAGPTPQLSCGGVTGHLRGSADGTTYLPSKGCFSAANNYSPLIVGGLETRDDGQTWSQYLVPGAVGAAFDPSVATTPDNTVYEAWENVGDYHPVVAASRDHGATWTTPTDLAGTVSPPLVASTFPSLVAGDNGRVAYSFLGSSVGSGNPNAPGFHGVWYLYTAFTYDGGATWTTVRDTATPVQYGEIDGGGAAATASQRNLLDFIDSSVTKDGRVVVAFADGCLVDCEQAGVSGDTATAESLSTHARASVAYQAAGKGLLAAYDAP